MAIVCHNDIYCYKDTTNWAHCKIKIHLIWYSPMLVQKQCIFMRFATDSRINIYRCRNINITGMFPLAGKIFMAAHKRFLSTRHDIMTGNGMDASVDKKTFLYNARQALFECQTDFIMIRNKLYHDVTWSMPTCKKDFITNLLTAITETDSWNTPTGLRINRN